jgi:hypothetical protein
LPLLCAWKLPKTPFYHAQANQNCVSFDKNAHTSRLTASQTSNTASRYSKLSQFQALFKFFHIEKSTFEELASIHHLLEETNRISTYMPNLLVNPFKELGKVSKLNHRASLRWNRHSVIKQDSRAN